MRDGHRPARSRRRAAVVVKAAGAYFAIVFACGFVLGTVRTLWIVPRLGERWAELAEMPVMLALALLAARWLDRRFDLRARGRAVQLGVGALALLLLLGAELLVVVGLRGVTLAEDLAGRDPVAGIAYALSLLAFAAMPAVAGLRGQS